MNKAMLDNIILDWRFWLNDMGVNGDFQDTFVVDKDNVGVNVVLKY